MLHMVVHILRVSFLSNDLHWDPNWQSMARPERRILEIVVCILLQM